MKRKTKVLELVEDREAHKKHVLKMRRKRARKTKTRKGGEGR